VNHAIGNVVYSYQSLGQLLYEMNDFLVTPSNFLAKGKKTLAKNTIKKPKI